MPRRCSRPDGAWEIIQFANAELVGERTYELSRLLRGQARHRMGDRRSAAGRRAVRAARRACGAVARGLDVLGRPMLAADRRSRPRPRRSGSGRARRRRRGRPRCVPLAPVHLRGRAAAAGVLSWITAHAARRRFLGVREVPLGEETRSVRGRHPRRRRCGAHALHAPPTVLYAAADEIADFGAPQRALGARRAGLGHGRTRYCRAGDTCGGGMAFGFNR